MNKREMNKFKKTDQYINFAADLDAVLKKHKANLSFVMDSSTHGIGVQFEKPREKDFKWKTYTHSIQMNIEGEHAYHPTRG